VEDLASAWPAAKIRREKVCLSTLVGDGPYDWRLFEAVGREFKSGLDYTLVFNVLSQMGIYAIWPLPSVGKTVFTGRGRSRPNMSWMFHEMLPEEEERLRNHLAGPWSGKRTATKCLTAISSLGGDVVGPGGTF
jgi:hypothetical protein